MFDLERLVCVKDFESYAEKYLPKTFKDFYNSGANDECTLKENIDAFKRLKIRPRRLRCTKDVDMTTDVLGHSIGMPICISPSAYQKLAHEDGEIGTARAAEHFSTCMGLSGWSTTELSAVKQCCSTAPLWFQMNVYRNRTMVLDLLKQARDVGCKAILLTVDAPVVGKRISDLRNRFYLPSHIKLPLFEKYVSKLEENIATTDRAKASYGGVALEPFADWEYLAFIKRHTTLPVVVKGILTKEDAETAIQYGADAIFVSNHGGRQLDGGVTSIEALPEVIRGVNGRVDVYLDGGVRTGTDVFKALALGAKAVFVGRPIIWGLAAGGYEGVKKVLGILREELETAMYLAGCQTLQDVDKSRVVHASVYHRL